MIELPVGVTTVIDGAIEFVYSFGPIAEKTVVLVPDFAKEQVANVAGMIGMDNETVAYVLGMLLCYPLGLIMLAIPYGNPRHFFSFMLGAFLLQFTLGVQWIHHLISSLVAYLMITVLPRKTLKTALPAFAIAYMTLGHLHRQYINYLGWDLDFTGSQMVLTQKLYMVAWNLYDGEQLEKGKADRTATKLKAFALKDTPSLLEFLGYTFCFSTILAGPATEFSTYLRVIDGSVFKTPSGKECKHPSNILPVLKPLVTSFICLGIHLYLSAMFPLLNPENPQTGTPAILQEDFLAKPFVLRYFHLWMGLFAIREKYYFGWKNAEGAANVWYSGFDGFDENGNALGWETSNNMNILGFELGQDLQTVTKEWNIKTSNWLQRYVYFRNPGSRALTITYALSAFWHGFYPGYYMFFLSVPLVTFCDRLGKKKLTPRFYKPKDNWLSRNSLPDSIYGVICMLATSITMNYMISAFIILAGGWAWQVYSSLYFFGHIGAVIFYLIVSQLKTPGGDKKKQK